VPGADAVEEKEGVVITEGGAVEEEAMTEEERESVVAVEAKAVIEGIVTEAEARVEVAVAEVAVEVAAVVTGVAVEVAAVVTGAAVEVAAVVTGAAVEAAVAPARPRRPGGRPDGTIPKSRPVGRLRGSGVVLVVDPSGDGENNVVVDPPDRPD
jgi:hypothetical protein